MQEVSDVSHVNWKLKHFNTLSHLTKKYIITVVAIAFFQSIIISFFQSAAPLIANYSGGTSKRG